VNWAIGAAVIDPQLERWMACHHCSWCREAKAHSAAYGSRAMPLSENWHPHRLPPRLI